MTSPNQQRTIVVPEACLHSHTVSECAFNISLKFEPGLGDGQSCFWWSHQPGAQKKYSTSCAMLIMPRCQAPTR